MCFGKSLFNFTPLAFINSFKPFFYFHFATLNLFTLSQFETEALEFFDTIILKQHFLAGGNGRVVEYWEV